MADQQSLFDEERILPHIEKQQSIVGIPNKVLLRPDEIAVIFDVSVQTVYLWAQLGVIPSVKCGGVLRFRRDDIVDILNRRRQG